MIQWTKEIGVVGLVQKPRALVEEDLKQNPLLLDLFTQAKSGRESLLSYDGITVAVLPVADITHTFTEAELEEFRAGYAEAADPDQRLTGDQILQIFRERDE